MSIAVIGAGKWGCALYHAFSQNHKPFISSINKRDIENFISIDEALEKEFLVFALSTQGIYEWLKTKFKNKGQKILLASKGVDYANLKFLDELFLNFISKEQLCVLSGPSFASEVMKKLPCALVLSAFDEKLAKDFSNFFPSYIKTYTNTDVRGAEICGAYKNVLAIASGISDGLKLGNNARASLMARGLVEMHRFGKAFGADDETFLGLSGAGDLFLSASSALSRNYRVGFMLSEGKNLDEILLELKEVAEGVKTAFAIKELASKEQIYTPIVNEIVLILQGKDVKHSLKDLLRRGNVD